MSRNRQHLSSNSSKKDSKSPIEVLVAKYGLTGTIVTSLLGLVGVGITAYLGYLGIRTQIEEPIRATQTAEARSTMLASLVTSTPSVIAPPPTAFTSSPVVLATPTYKVCVFSIETPFRPLWEIYKTKLGCPTDTAVQIPRIAEQCFQGGHMFWRVDTDDVYIIFDRKLDGTELYFGDWRLNPVDWKWDGSYPHGVGLVPPPNLHEPVRGFGWLWRTHYGGPDGPLGWALDREYGWDNIATAQTFEMGIIFRGSTPKIYVLLDNGEFYAQP